MKLFPLSIFCLLSAISLHAQTTTAPTKWFTYKDSLHPFTVQYPSDWEFKKPGTNTRFFITSYKENEEDQFRDNINCIARKIEQKGFTIRMAEDAVMKSLAEKLKDFSLVNSTYSQWNGAESLELEYTCTMSSAGNNFDIHMLQRMAVIKGTLYTITFTSEDASYHKYIPVVTRVIKSFTVK
jgi:hypothetical protein